MAPSIKIIRACAKLHNFLVDTRGNTDADDEYYRNFASANVQEELGSSATIDEEDTAYPLVTDTNALKPRGRKTNSQRLKTERGAGSRDLLCMSLAEDNLQRPRTNRMKYNEVGLVYFE